MSDAAEIPQSLRRDKLLKFAAKLLEDDRRPVETAAYAEDGNGLLGDAFPWLRPFQSQC